MSEKVTNRRRERILQDAFGRYDHLEEVISRIEADLNEVKEELHNAKIDYDQVKGSLPKEEANDYLEQLQQADEDIELIADDFTFLTSSFEKIIKMKEKANPENKTHQIKLLRRVNPLIDQADDLSDEVESLRDEIFEIHEDFIELKGGKKEKGFSSIHDISGAINQAFDEIKKAFKFEPSNKTSKSARLSSILPFLDQKELSELVEMILNDHQNLQDVELAAIFPFLEKEDCDKIFLAKMNTLKKRDLIGLIPFVSSKTLSKLVDEYINGNLTNINIDAIYPFLDQVDIKRVFFYELKKSE